MRGASARLFVALDPPVEVTEELAAWARGLIRGARGQRDGALRLLDASSLHLTLCFLGERPLAQVEAIAAALASLAAQASACELTLGAPLWLPPRRPRALAVEAHEPSGELARLAHSLTGALAAPAPGARARRFRAHITLARLRAGSRPGIDVPLPPTPALCFTAQEAILYRSWLEPQGARYEPLARAPLSVRG
jgi:2'-5' RNA ligase